MTEEQRERRRAAKKRARRRYRERHRIRFNAQRSLQIAVQEGRMVRPSTCSQCGNEGRIEAHHTDYTKPYDVIWLCQPCHVLEHHPNPK